MKVHVIYTSPEVQVENSEEICKDIVNDIVDKMFMQENSTLEITHDQPTLKRKLTDDGNNTIAKRKLHGNDNDNDELDLDALRKTLKEQTAEHDRKLALGKAVENILAEGEVKQSALSKDMQEALEAYRKEDDQFDVYKDAVLYPWQQELMKHMIPTDRQVIWVVGEKTDEGKSFFQKYIKAMYGTRHVVSGINLKTSSKNIAQSLRKHSLVTADIFLFNLGKSKKDFEKVNYEMLEFLKDGDAFAEKYDSEKLKIKTPNVVMVFSNHFPEMEELAPNRWKVFTIRDKQLVEEIFMKDGEDKKLTSEEKKKLDNEICENICWCSHHKCKEDDKYNNCMGLDLEYMMEFWSEKNVEKRYKCENCEFDSAEMEDVKKHFMEHHRENYMYKCWKCKEEMKTISQLKNHYEKAHFMKDLTYLKKKLNKCGKKKYMKKKTYNSKYP